MTPRSAGATAHKTADLYLGDWELIPELCVYEFGSAPVTGAYLIAKQGRKLRITIEWSMSAGTEAQSTGFEAPPDGSPQPVPAGVTGSGPDTFTLTRVDERTLDSAAFRGEEQVAYARRVASVDGALLAVVQEARDPHGERYRNFQVYRRRGARRGTNGRRRTGS